MASNNKQWDTVQEKSIATVDARFWIFIVCVVSFFILGFALWYEFDKHIALMFVIGIFTVLAYWQGQRMAMSIIKETLGNFVDAQEVAGTTNQGMLKMITGLIGLKRELARMEKQSLATQPAIQIEQQPAPWEVIDSPQQNQLTDSQHQSGPVYFE